MIWSMTHGVLFPDPCHGACAKVGTHSCPLMIACEEYNEIISKLTAVLTVKHSSRS